MRLILRILVCLSIMWIGKTLAHTRSCDDHTLILNRDFILFFTGVICTCAFIAIDKLMRNK